MSDSLETSMFVLDRLIDPLTRCLDIESARRVVQFEVDAAVQARVAELAERANEGTLTDDERSEYEAYIDAADFIAIFKAKAQRLLVADEHS